MRNRRTMKLLPYPKETEGQHTNPLRECGFFSVVRYVQKANCPWYVTALELEQLLTPIIVPM